MLDIVTLQYWRKMGKPKLYLRAQMPLINAFRRGRNGAPHTSEANIEYRYMFRRPSNPTPATKLSGRTARRLSITKARSQHDIPAATLNIARACFASECQPEDTSSTPRRRISALDHGSFSPRHRRTHCTAASSSLRRKTQSPVSDGRSAHEETGARARNSHAPKLENVD